MGQTKIVGAPDQIWVQVLEEKFLSAFSIDPREVHDNGKPIYRYVRIDLVADPVQQWQPIETAPKDGTRVLLTNGKEVIMGHYGRNAAKTHDMWFDAISCFSFWPTHWMPLPSPHTKEQSK